MAFVRDRLARAKAIGRPAFTWKQLDRNPLLLRAVDTVIAEEQETEVLIVTRTFESFGKTVSLLDALATLVGGLAGMKYGNANSMLEYIYRDAPDASARKFTQDELLSMDEI